MQERKQDTRQKIQLGGLVKKAGLHEEPPAVLLGLLLEAKENRLYRYLSVAVPSILRVTSPASNAITFFILGTPCA